MVEVLFLWFSPGRLDRWFAFSALGFNIRLMKRGNAAP
jgi:hypothetical protein